MLLAQSQRIFRRIVPAYYRRPNFACYPNNILFLKRLV